MKKYFSALVTLALLLFGAACVPQETNTSETDEKGGKTETSTAPSVTVGADNVSAISVVLKGKANLTNSAASDLKVGFQYSKSVGILPSNSISLEAEDADAEYHYTTSITGLEPETTYYFRSFVRQNNVDSYGETKSFTTKNIASLLETLDASEVEPTSAALNAKLDLTDVLYKDLVYGFYWGKTEQEQNTWLKGGQLTDNAFSAAMTSLPHKTQYWYKAYVKLDNQTFYGETKAFTTDVIKVKSVSLNRTEYTFNTIGSSLTLKATVLPEDVTDNSLEWSSDDEDVATVDADGKVTAKGNGKVTITVTTKDQGKTATCDITVSQWVTRISLDQTSISLNEGQEQTLIPTVNPDDAADKTLKWTSLNEGVATVDKNGKVTAVSKGSVTIRAEANDGSGKYATCSVTVKRLVTSIQLNKTSLVLYRGASNVTGTLTATVIPSDASNTAVTWSTSNTSIATVSGSGIVTGRSIGTATIKVMANDGSGVYASCAVTVKKPFVPSSVDLGLPSGLKWANANLGANAIEEYGDYYAFGETEPYYSSQDPLTWKDGKTGYNWASYSLCNGSSSTLTKYNNNNSYGTVDYKTVLESVDDAAHAKLGGKWRMPAHEEWWELMTSCTWTWTNDYNGTGVAGKIVTSNVDGYEDKSIFFPAAGYWHLTNLDGVGSLGYYWSSSIILENPYYPSSANFSPYYGVGIGGHVRCDGLPIRPVTE